MLETRDGYGCSEELETITQFWISSEGVWAESREVQVCRFENRSERVPRGLAAGWPAIPVDDAGHV